MLLLSLPAQAQVERTGSMLNSRHRSESPTGRGGWISPGGEGGSPVWTLRDELTVRRVFRSVSGATASEAMARAEIIRAAAIRRMQARLEKAASPTKPASRFNEPKKAQDDTRTDALDTAAALTSLQVESSLQEEAESLEVADPALDELVEENPGSVDSTEEEISDPADQIEAPDFRIRDRRDSNRPGIGELQLPEDDPAADQEPSKPETAEQPLAEAPAMDQAPQAAILSPARPELAIPGTRQAPLQPRLGDGPGGQPDFEVRGDLKRISRGNSRLHQVALTFDDGPHPEYTAQILTILDFYNAPATFFFVGVQASRYPEWVQMTSQQGHEIASQTYDHFRLPKLPQAEKEYQIDAYQDLVEELTGRRPRFLRPPGGQIDDASIELLARRGMVCALWDVALNDTTAGRTRDEMLEHALSEVRNGSVILAHDGVQATIDLLPELIERLREEGYELVTMSELASGL